MSTAVSLTNSMAGGDIDIHVGDKIYPISPPTGENYDDLIALTKSLLYEKDFDSAYEILQKIPNNVPQAGHANLLKTLAILAGRSFNSIRPLEKSKLEKCLNLAQRKMENKLIPSILLTILEIDYYHFHGQISENGISLEKVVDRQSIKQLTEEDIRILGLLKISSDTKRKVGLYF